MDIPPPPAIGQFELRIRAIEEHRNDAAACLAQQDQIIADLKSQNTAQESRIHALEQKTESLGSASVGAIQRLNDRCDWLTQRFDDVYTALKKGGFALEMFEALVAPRRGLPRKPFEQRVVLIDTPEVSQSKAEIDATHYEGLAGQ